MIAIITVRLVLLRTYFLSDDMFFNSIASGIATQCLLCVTIITACIPSVKPFLDGFESGMLAVSLKRPEGKSNLNSYEMNNSNSAYKSALRLRNMDGDGAGYLAAISGQRSRASQGKTGSLDSGKSDAMIIKRTDQWDIRYENAHSPSLEP